MIDSASFKIRFPEFDTVDNARVDLFIGDSVIMLNETYWGDKYDLGLYYLTAHYLSLSIKSGAGSPFSGSGPIASRSVDGTSVAYAVAASDDEWKNYLLRTTYGQRYLALVKTLGVPAFVI